MKHHRELHTKLGTEVNLENKYNLPFTLKKLSENLYKTWTTIVEMDDLPF